MRHILSLLFLVLIAAQSAAWTGPFRYCMAEGNLCCSGRETDTCCDRTQDSGPGLGSGAACSDVEAGLEWMPAAGTPHVPAPCLTPAPGTLSPPTLFSPFVCAVPAQATLKPPHLATTILLL